MEELFTFLTTKAVVLIDAMAFVVIAIGSIEAFYSAIRLMFLSPDGHERRDVWLRYARWLVAGLTFQLAADIIETSISTSWEAVARLGAIALIRTFLNYFLERDLADVRERERKSRHTEDTQLQGNLQQR
jgi:uncharacterized membrane protein